MKHLIGRAGVVAAVAFGTTVVVATPSWADSIQHSYCDFGQTGTVTWREPEDYAGFIEVRFYVRDVHNNIVRANDWTQTFKSPATFRAIQTGDDYYAPYAVWISWDSWTLEKRGTSCRDSANLALNLTAPEDPPPARGSVPPLPTGTFVVDPVDAPIN